MFPSAGNRTRDACVTQLRAASAHCTVPKEQFRQLIPYYSPPNLFRHIPVVFKLFICTVTAVFPRRQQYFYGQLLTVLHADTADWARRAWWCASHKRPTSSMRASTSSNSPPSPHASPSNRSNNCQDPQPPPHARPPPASALCWRQAAAVAANPSSWPPSCRVAARSPGRSRVPDPPCCPTSPVADLGRGGKNPVFF
jgi:hypothetical protein